MNIASGITIGGIIGFIAGFGYLNMNVKKSQWSDLIPTVTIITTIAGASIGGKIGYELQRSVKIDSALGLDKVEHKHFQVGRSWQSESTWEDVDGNVHKLKTIRDTLTTASYFNGNLILRHGNSASSVNILKYHKQALNEAFNKLREEHDFRT